MFKIYKSSQLKMGKACPIEIKTPRSSLSSQEPCDGEDYNMIQEMETEQNPQKYLENIEQEAQEMIRAAEQEAAGVLEKSYHEARQQKEQAREEGYREGYDAGLEAGRETGYEEMRQLVDEAAELKQAAYDQRRELTEQLEQDIVQLVIRTARSVIQTELQEHQDLIFRLIEEGLRKCNYTENLLIHVSEMDYDLVYAYKNRIYLMTEGIYDIEVKSDPAMSPGSVLIETASGQVDASIETQLGQIETAFRELLNSEG